MECGPKGEAEGDKQGMTEGEGEAEREGNTGVLWPGAGALYVHLVLRICTVGCGFLAGGLCSNVGHSLAVEAEILCPLQRELS